MTDNFNPSPLTVQADRLKGRKVLVMGGSSGIGEAAVRRFAAEGAAVAVAARREDRLNELCKRVIADGGDAAYVICDVGNEESVAQAVDFAADRLGGLDGAFNAA